MRMINTVVDLLGRAGRALLAGLGALGSARIPWKARPVGLLVVCVGLFCIAIMFAFADDAFHRYFMAPLTLFGAWLFFSMAWPLVATPLALIHRVEADGFYRQTMGGTDFHPWSEVEDLRLVHGKILFTDKRRQDLWSMLVKPQSIVEPNEADGLPADMLQRMIDARDAAVGAASAKEAARA